MRRWMTSPSDPPHEGWARASGWRRRWLPVGGLLLALSAVFLFGGPRDLFYSHSLHDQDTAKTLALARNLSTQHGFLFLTKGRRLDGGVGYQLYNRFPVGAFVLTKLAIAPFGGDFSAQIVAARTLMLAFFCAAAVFAYLGLARLAGSRAVALAATLLAFSSYHLLLFSDAVSNEMSPDLFAVMLVFHGAVLFEAEGGRRRFWELALRVCVALLLGWHVYGLLLPYLAIVATREATAAWRQRSAMAKGRAVVDARAFAGRLAAAAAGALRGRAALLGALALLFGAGVLGWNLAWERAAFAGQRPVAELPSVRSMLARTGLRESRYAASEERQWPTFLRWQFHRVGASVPPFALSGGADFDEYAWRDSKWLLLFWTGVVATLGALAGLAFLRGPRAPPAALALAGFGWALLVPHSVAWDSHQFETMFHVGVPLCLFAALLLVARRLWRPAPAFCAAAAVLVFAASSVALGLRQGNADEARAERAQMAEFQAIAKAIRNKSVWVAAHHHVLNRFVQDHRLVDFYLAGSFVTYAGADPVDDFDPKAIAALDFVLAFERYEIPALLTPEHRSVFLYRAGADAGAVLAAMREARREEHRRLRALAPVARSAWDIHVVSAPSAAEVVGRTTELAYFKAPCAVDDTEGLFQLRLLPVGGAVPWGLARDLRRRDWYFREHGSRVDGKCLMRVPLPAWPVAAVHAGQVHPAGGAARWRMVFRLDVERLRAAWQAVRDEPPAVRGAFDVWLGEDQRGRGERNHGGGRVLRYARAPCTPADVRRRFFLHVVPEVLSALPRAMRRSGFDNLDFEFGEHGALFDGVCFAMLTLPDYGGVARIRTGQIDADTGDAVWRVELAPNAAVAGG